MKQFQKVLNEISFTRVLAIAGTGRSLFLHKGLESGDYAEKISLTYNRLTL